MYEITLLHCLVIDMLSLDAFPDASFFLADSPAGGRFIDGSSIPRFFGTLHVYWLAGLSCNC